MPETNNGTSESSGTAAATETAIGYFKRRPTETALFLARLITIYYSIYYVLPFKTPFAQNTAYFRAFFAAIATNALRLRQRVGGVEFSREFLIRIKDEDPCHYLLYSLLFAPFRPVILALCPIFLFALLHVASFLEKFCVATGYKDSSVAKQLHDFSAKYTWALLVAIASVEAFMLPLITILTLIKSYSFIFLLLVYCVFLRRRYKSRRNPATRTVVRELHLIVLAAAGCPFCPKIIYDLTFSVTFYFHWLLFSDWEPL